MKMPNRSFAFALGATLAVASLLPASLSAQSTPDANETRLMQSLKIPSNLDEIAQLSKAGVGDAVILAYIKDSPTAYNLNASEIIKLRDQGVSPEVTAALIQRGTEVRQAAQTAAQTSQSTEIAAAPSYQTQPAVEQAVTYVPTPVIVQPASTVSVHYFGAPTYYYPSANSYYYPRYTSYGSYATFGSRYCPTPRASFSVGFGSRHYGGSYSRARYCR